MKNFKKLFLITSILLLTFSLNGLVFASITANTKTRLNKVIKKVSIKDDDKRKSFLILLVNLKSKYKDSSDIEGMINYLENNVCAKSTYTQTKINTAINDIITKFKNEGYEKIKTEIIAGIKLLEANPYNAIGVRCQVALYDNINENKIFGKYERGYLVEADIDNYITNNYSEDVDNTTTTDIVDDTTNTTTENKCKIEEKHPDGSCYSSNGGDAFITKDLVVCYKNDNIEYYKQYKILPRLEDREREEVYCEAEKNYDLSKLCEGKNENWKCTNGKISNNGAWCLGNKYFPTIEKANASGVDCRSNCQPNIDIEKGSLLVNQSKKFDRPAIFQNERFSFKQWFKPNKEYLEKSSDKFFTNPYTIEWEKHKGKGFFSFSAGTTNAYFKVFVPKGLRIQGELRTLWADTCYGVKLITWRGGPFRPLKETYDIGEYYNGKGYYTLSKSITQGTIGNILIPSDINKEAGRVYFSFEYNGGGGQDGYRYYAGCSPYADPEGCCEYTGGLSGYGVSMTFNDKNFKEYYDRYNNEAKWETNGDPAYDCSVQ